MRAAVLTVLLLLLVISLSLAQPGAPPQGQDLQRWDFDQEPMGWTAAHSVAPLRTAHGELVVDCTGPDPWIEGPPGLAPFTGEESQFIVMRAKAAQPGTAEFFWEVEGKGFAAGQEVGFHMSADGYRIYRVFPVWKGQVTRLRFDPADVPGQKVWIDWLAVVSLPVSPAPAEPVWDFGRGLQGFIPQANVSEFSLADGQLRLLGEGAEGPMLLSPRLDVPADQARYLCLTMTTNKVRRVIVYFTTQEKDEPDARRFLILPTQGQAGERSWAVDTSKVPNWTGRLSRLRFQFDAAGSGPVVWLRRASLVPRPLGGPALSLEWLRAPAVMCLGETRQVALRVQNSGGVRLEQPEIELSGLGKPVRQRLPSLEPGEQQECRLRLQPGQPGTAVLVARARAQGAEAGASPVLVTVSRAPGLPPAGSGPRAVRRGGDLWLANGRVAAAFVRNPYGYGPVFLFRRDGQGWRRMGVLAPPVVEGTDFPALAFPTLARTGRQGALAAVTLTGPAGTGRRGIAGKLSTSYALGRGDTLEVAAALTSARAAGLILFRPIALLAGEGSFGADLQEAIFPGLEYLTRGERSSGTLDASPPHDLRFAPHPHRITVPLMAVASPRGDVVSLMWQMPASARQVGPAAAFASPNWLRSQDNHLMSLFLPAIPAWTPENSLQAPRPMPLAPGQTLQVKGTVYLGQGEVLQAVRAWWGRYGDPALPRLVRSYRQEVAFCLRGYEQTCRRPGRGWLVGQGWTSTPGRHTGIATQYLLGEQVLGSDAPYPDLPARALGEMKGARDIHLAVHAGDLEQGLLALRSNAYQILAGQGPDGGWRFEPSKQTAILGAAGEKEIGFAGNRVAVLLNAARMLQDRTLLAAGLRGLKFMDQFRIPRAAQTWEVPVHTPDVLAAAYAVDAYLAGYLATGRQKYLRQAGYWAETGLHFNYFWQADEPGVEAMNGGGIPVLGATFFTWPWYGRIVQWCALDYAASLLRLAPYDRTYPWRRIAEAITRSGMAQQRREPNHYGMYPDSVGMIDKIISWGAMIAPVRICENVLVLLGKRPLADVKTIPLGGAAASLIYGGELSVIRHSGSDLELALRYPAGHTSFLGLVGVSEGAKVWREGRLLPAGDLDRLAEGTRYSPGLAALAIKVRHGSQPVRVRLSGLRPGRPLGAGGRWTFDRDTEGWIAQSDLQLLRVSGGALVVTITGEDPYLATGVPALPTARYGRLRLRLRAPQGGPAQVFFSAAAPMSEANSIHFQAEPSPLFRDYVLELRALPGWRGVLSELRIDPPGKSGDRVEIDEVALLP